MLDINKQDAIEQKGMTFDYDFGYSFPFSLPSSKKLEEEKENELAKIQIIFYSV